MQDNTVSILLNQSRGTYLYPLENQLRNLAKGASTYVIGLFDCCREKQKFRGSPSVDLAADDDENLILAFGCPPSRYTPAQSTLATDFFDFLCNSADANGYVSLPGNLNFFHTQDNKNETLIKVSRAALWQLAAPRTEQSGEQVKQQLISLIHELNDQQSNRMLSMVKQLLCERRGTNPIR